MYNVLLGDFNNLFLTDPILSFFISILGYEESAPAGNHAADAVPERRSKKGRNNECTKRVGLYIYKFKLIEIRF